MNRLEIKKILIENNFQCPDRESETFYIYNHIMGKRVYNTEMDKRLFLDILCDLE